jgi:opacity protein-like surface antigen
MGRIFVLIFTLALAGLTKAAPRDLSTPVVLDPSPHKVWEVSVETAQTIGADNSSNNYFATQFFSFGIEPFRPLVIGPLRVRWQLINSFVASAILDGPDQYFLGWAPQIRAIVPLGESRWSIYGTFGAGMGAANANENDPNDGGLGQDFNFLLMSNAGARYAITETWSVWLGGVWLHLSNAEMSEPKKENIGADSFGVVLGAGWAF